MMMNMRRKPSDKVARRMANALLRSLRRGEIEGAPNDMEALCVDVVFARQIPGGVMRRLANMWRQFGKVTMISCETREVQVALAQQLDRKIA
jgi:hypothetical protein